MDDTQLLREYAQKGSEPAFARLVETQLDLVYSAALRRVGGDHHRAEEVAQMVFTDLARKAAHLQNHPLLAGWLHRSTRWAAASLRRAEHRRTANEQAAATDSATAGASEPPTDWAQLSPLLDQALDSLNEQDRDAVILRYFNNRPFAEIGTSLGLSENAARMRVERALAKLQTLLKKRGVTSTAAALGLTLAQNAVSAAPANTAATLSTTALSTVAAGGSSLLTYFLMTKLQLTLAGAGVLALAVGLTLQTNENRHLQNDLASLQSRLASARSTSTTSHNQVAILETKLKQLNDAIAVQTPPLTPDQQERVRLDTIIRKGELDMEYASLFRRLKLSPEPLDQFKVLIVERNQILYDANKLAKSEGLDFATPSESRPLGECVTSEIDSRIASLLGSAGYSQFQEYLKLQPFHLWAVSLLSLETNLNVNAQEILTNPAFDTRTAELAKIISTVAPRYLDQQYQSSGWPVDPPAEFRAALAQILSPEAMQRFDEETVQNAQRRRMYEIARDAALQGKLKLSKSSARDYPSPTQNQPVSAK